MFDQTLVSGIGWTIFFVVAWFALIAWAVKLALKFKGADDHKLVWDRQKVMIFLWVLVFFVLTVFTSTNWAYRPKQTLSPFDADREERLQEIDTAEPIEIPEASQSLTEREDWKTVKDRNVEGNRQAIDEFDELPNHEGDSSEDDPPDG